MRDVIPPRPLESVLAVLLFCSLLPSAAWALECEISSLAVAEGDATSSQQLFSVTLSEPNPNPFDVAVDYATNPNDSVSFSATAGVDYTAAAGTLTFPPGVQTQAIPIEILGDFEYEPSELLRVDLSNPVGMSIDPLNGWARATILNEDVQVSINARPPVVEGDTTADAFMFEATLNSLNPKPFPVTVDYATNPSDAVPNRATAGVDYTEAAGTLTLPPGVQTQAIPIEILGDFEYEPSELLRVDLSNPVGMSIHSFNFWDRATILNDDPTPTISVGDAEVTEGDDLSTVLTSILALSNPTSSTVQVGVSTSDVTATADVDYLPLSQVILIPPGSTEFAIEITVFGDLDIEGDESFQIDLTNAIFATIDDGQAEAIIRDDDTVVEIPSLQGLHRVVLAVALLLASARHLWRRGARTGHRAKALA